MGTAGISAGDVYHYALKAGGRVVVVWGLLHGRDGDHDLDTGLLQADFIVGGLHALLGQNRRGLLARPASGPTN